jgi:thiamine-monophosphate kinase
LPGKTSWWNVGWKALAVNLSDMAAMGGMPVLALVTLYLPADFCVEDLQEVYRGLGVAATSYDVKIGGGDIVRAPVFSITVALSGWAVASPLRQPQIMTRSSARAGDLVAVTGTLGDSAAGLGLIKDDDEASPYLRQRHEKPEPRLESARKALDAGIRCAIDISDGLVQDLGHVARASNVAIRLEAGRIPLSAELTQLLPGRALGLALTGGEDYELALIGPGLAIEPLLALTDPPITLIGEVIEAHEPHVGVIDERGQEIPLGNIGWDHLKPR